MCTYKKKRYKRSIYKKRSFFQIAFFKLAVYILNHESIELQNYANKFILAYNEPLELNELTNAVCKIIYNNTDESNLEIIRI